MSVSLRWKLPDPLAWVSTAIGRQLEPGQGEAMVTFLFPFGKGGRRRPGCPSGKECGEQWAETLKHLRAWLPYLTQAHPQGAYGGGAGSIRRGPPAEIWGNWLCRLRPDSQKRLGWSLKVNMPPPPHSPGQRVLISCQDPRMKPQSIGNTFCGKPGRGQEGVGPLHCMGVPHCKRQFDTLEHGERAEHHPKGPSKEPGDLPWGGGGKGGHG